MTSLGEIYNMGYKTGNVVEPYMAGVKMKEDEEDRVVKKQLQAEQLRQIEQTKGLEKALAEDMASVPFEKDVTSNQRVQTKLDDGTEYDQVVPITTTQKLSDSDRAMIGLAKASKSYMKFGRATEGLHALTTSIGLQKQKAAEAQAFMKDIQSLQASTMELASKYGGAGKELGKAFVADGIKKLMIAHPEMMQNPQMQEILQSDKLTKQLEGLFTNENVDFKKSKLQSEHLQAQVNALKDDWKIKDSGDAIAVRGQMIMALRSGGDFKGKKITPEDIKIMDATIRDMKLQELAKVRELRGNADDKLAKMQFAKMAEIQLKEKQKPYDRQLQTILDIAKKAGRELNDKEKKLQRTIMQKRDALQNEYDKNMRKLLGDKYTQYLDSDTSYKEPSLADFKEMMKQAGIKFNPDGGVIDPAARIENILAEVRSNSAGDSEASIRQRLSQPGSPGGDARGFLNRLNFKDDEPALSGIINAFGGQ